jgi:hypothetical protein
LIREAHQPGRFRAAIRAGAIDQLEHVLPFRTRVADRVLGLRDRGREASRRNEQAEPDDSNPDICEHDTGKVPFVRRERKPKTP